MKRNYLKKIKFLKALLATALVSVLSISGAALSGKADEAQDSVAAVSVYRLNHPASGEHLYTADTNEVEILSASGWKNEGPFWNAPVSGMPVYRLNNPKAFHLYTMDENEVDTLVSGGSWTVDNGGAPCFYSGGEAAIYRLYNESQGRHLLTPDANEYSTLSERGWSAEGTALLAVSVPERPVVLETQKTICIDAGHQRNGDSTPEPNGPGSSVKKARVTSGTRGRTTGVAEYELNLAIALKLEEELVSRGYNVVMTRRTHDVNISNMERAKFATANGADITVRIHGNGSDNTSVNGALCMVPSSSNPYVSSLSAESGRLGRNIIDSYCAATGMKNQGLLLTDDMTGINFCTMPVTIIEMGFMTNPTDDTNMQNPSYQTHMVSGIADGIDKYFGR